MPPKRLTAREYFDAMAHMRMGWLHPGGERATALLFDQVGELGGVGRMLEFGCGTGHTAQLMLRRWRGPYTGIDLSPVMLEQARRRLAKDGSRAKLRQLDMDRDPWPFAAGSFELIVAESVLGVVDAEHALDRLTEALAPGGWLAINERLWGDAESDGATAEVLEFPIASRALPRPADWVDAYNLGAATSATAPPCPMASAPSSTAAVACPSGRCTRATP